MKIRNLKGSIVLLLCLLFLLVSFTACGNSLVKVSTEETASQSKETEINNKSSLNNDNLTVNDTILKSVISLGMEKNDVDKLLGLQEKKDFRNVYNYQGLEVFYRDNKVAGLTIKASLNETDRFKTFKKIGLGNSKDDIIKAYGDSIEKSSSKYLTYFFEKKDSSLVKLTEAPKNIGDGATKNLILCK